jgi:hypothetical protein
MPVFWRPSSVYTPTPIKDFRKKKHVKLCVSAPPKVEMKPYIQGLVPYALRMKRPSAIQDNPHRVKFRADYERAIQELSSKRVL